MSEIRTWIALARDAEGVHCYRFSSKTTSIPQARKQFLHIAFQEGWEPFTEVEMILVPLEPQLQTFNKVAFFPITEAKTVAHDLDNDPGYFIL